MFYKKDENGNLIEIARIETREDALTLFRDVTVLLEMWKEGETETGLKDMTDDFDEDCLVRERICERDGVDIPIFRSVATILASYLVRAFGVKVFGKSAVSITVE